MKIITVEDPIEYRLKGILQTQTDDKKGYTFPKALRALLRQNPDIMMIGEIRDDETAQIAVQASLTGTSGSFDAPHQQRCRIRSAAH